MFTINKMRCDHVLDFAAEELKKYVRMMMPECGEIEIATAPDATDGFRLGLFEDFGMPNEAEDPYIDDIVYVDAGPDGGVLAGSNPRSVLFAVYRFLRLNGCRWLYPGVDGDYVPVKDLEQVKYRKAADMRFRGHCNEGSESQQCMLETIDFYAKQELNVYMMEFTVPFSYYDNYYSHKHNDKNRPPEPVSRQQVLQWKRQCEAEIAKRGLQFHDMGHGWTCEPFGLAGGTWAKHNGELPEEVTKYLAKINGKRELFHGVPLNTNLCMSNPEVRTIMATAIADYAEKHRNVAYLHVWLADGVNNHCECENCVKKLPSDWYIDIMNETDEIMTKRGLDNRVVFISYVDTLFAPEKSRIKNPKRFALLYAPISRLYQHSINGSSVIPPQPKYVRNKFDMPKDEEENFAFIKEWRKDWKGPCFLYEYHFWRAQYYDLGGLTLARRIYDDIRGMKELGLNGFVEDGSQRSFFPNGFPMYVYAETQMNVDVSFDELMNDYFGHIYGDDTDKVLEYLKGMGEAFDFGYMFGAKEMINPGEVERLDKVAEYAALGRAIAKRHMNMPTRPQTVSYRLLLRHAEYCEGLAKVIAERAKGHNVRAAEAMTEFFDDFGKYEVEIERYYDQGLAGHAIKALIRTRDKNNYYYM